MKLNMLRAVIVAVAIALPCPVSAQSSPGWGFGFVPTPGQWNAAFAAKQDALGYTPLNIAGGTMTGELVTTPSVSLSAGFNIPPGVAPGSPVNGDIWETSAGIFAQINGTTIGPLSGATSSSFGNTSPITVSFPSGIVTYACPTCGVTGNPLSQFSTTTSTQLRSIISDPTGSGGGLVFATSPTVSNPTVTGSLTATGLVTLADLVTGTQDTLLGYFTSATASSTAVPNCANSLTYATGTHTFGCNAGAGTGNVANSGTPTANQIAQWTSATTIQGVNLASLLTAGAGIAISGTTSPTIALSLANTTVQASPTNPTGTANTTTGAMMGLGSTCKLTPVYSTRVRFEMVGNISNTSSGAGTQPELVFGTGTAPVNGAAATGTVIGSRKNFNPSAGGNNTPFTVAGIVTGLTVGTALWFDINLVVGAGTGTVLGIDCNAMEF